MTNNEFELDLDFLEDEKPTDKKQSNDLNLPESKDDVLDLDNNIEDNSKSNSSNQSNISQEDDFLSNNDNNVIPGIDLGDNYNNSDKIEMSPVVDEKPTSSLSKVLNNKNQLFIAGGAFFLFVLLIGGALFFYMSSNSKTKVSESAVVTEKPASVIEDQSETGATENTSNSLSLETTPIVNKNTVDTNISTPVFNETVATNNTGSTVSTESTGGVNTNINNVLNTNTLSTVENVVKKEPSDISIPLKSITEKLEVNSDGSLKKTENKDLETRNVKDGSIIIDNSQNKLPNILDISVSGVKEGQIFKISDDIKISIDGVTNSLSIDPVVKSSINKDAFIININLAFFKDSIISSEKGTIKYSETLPLDFMKPGTKRIFVLVNGVIFKTINFNIQ